MLSRNSDPLADAPSHARSQDDQATGSFGLRSRTHSPGHERAIPTVRFRAFDL